MYSTLVNPKIGSFLLVTSQVLSLREGRRKVYFFHTSQQNTMIERLFHPLNIHFYTIDAPPILTHICIDWRMVDHVVRSWSMDTNHYKRTDIWLLLVFLKYQKKDENIPKLLLWLKVKFQSISFYYLYKALNTTLKIIGNNLSCFFNQFRSLLMWTCQPPIFHGMR